MSASPEAAGARGVWAVRLDALHQIVLAGMLLAFGTLLVWRPLAGWLDFWAHAAVGRWIWQQGHVPNGTLFLWTAETPWVYHSWLSQVLFYGLTNVGGPQDLPWVVLTFTTLVVLLPFALIGMVWRWSGRLSSWLAIPVVLALKGISLRFQTRPELFTELSLSVLLAFLVAWSGAPGSSRPEQIPRRHTLGLAVVLLLFVTWANLHGAVVIGLLVLAVTAGCDLVQDRFDRRSRLLALLVLLAPLAVCVNPYGLSWWQGLRPVGGHTFAHIQEWVPVWKGPPLPAEMALAAVVLPALALLAWGLNPNRRWAHLAWLVLLGGLFLPARRNIWPFSLTCLMVLAANAHLLDPEFLWQKAGAWMRRSGKRAQPLPALLRWPFRMALLAWVVLGGLVLVINSPRGRPLLPTRLEQGVVRFLRENEAEGRIFNDYENSSYLQWSLAGQPPLYLDLLNAYADEVMRDYQDLVRLTPRGRELLEEQQIEWVVLTTNRGGSPSLAVLASHLDKIQLDKNPQWARIYASGDGVIWVRRTPKFAHLWKPLSRKVSPVEFAVLEKWGEDGQVIQSAFREDFGRPDAQGAGAKPDEKPAGPRK